MPTIQTRSGATYSRIGNVTERRGELIETNRALLDACRRERRDMSAEEVREYDTRDDEIGELTDAIQAWEREQNQPLDFRAVQGAESDDDPTPRRRNRSLNGDQEDALRAIESRHLDLPAATGDRLTEHVERDRQGAEARYLAAVSDPDYRSAFFRAVFGGEGAARQLSDAEAEAMQRVGEAMQFRAMQGGVSGDGGFALPTDIDPTILLTSDGAINPIRQLARVTTTTERTFRSITSEGVSASWVPELEEVGDDTPTIQGPEITPEKAAAWVEFSVEVDADWEELGSELSRLLADARDVLEAEAFSSGSGSDEPEGIVTALSGGSSVVEVSALDADAVYEIEAAVPPRFAPRSSWLSANTTMSTIHRLEGGGSSDERALTNDSRTEILGRPWREVSTMDTTADPGDQPLLIGDYQAGYRVVDRIGATIEPVRTVVGTNHRPIGARGLYFYWRTGAGVTVANALRLLEIESS